MNAALRVLNTLGRRNASSSAPGSASKWHPLAMELWSRGRHNEALGLTDPAEIWKLRSKEVSKLVAPSPYAGRSLSVASHLNSFQATWLKLSSILAANRVRQDLRANERYEKPGAKRRRLSSERWRARFKEEVRRKVQLVGQIRKRGS